MTGPDADNPWQHFDEEPNTTYLGLLCGAWWKKNLGGDAYVPANPPRLSWASYNGNGHKDGAEMTVVTPTTRFRYAAFFDRALAMCLAVTRVLR